MDIITAENLTYSYTGKKNALENIDFSIKEGEFVSVIGRNGSGKSTLSKLLNGLLTPTSGKVFVSGLDTSDKKNSLEVKKTVGVVFQNPDNQLVASIVEDDVAFGVENLGLSREEMVKRVDFALETVGMTEFKRSTPSRLSGGQKQRIAIAGILAITPKVIVLDESTSMLDPVGRKEVMAIARKLNREQGVTVINITHYMEETLSSDKILILDKGKLVASGTPAEIFSDGEKLLSLGLTLPLAGRISMQLKSAGLGVDLSLSKEDLEEEICRLLLRD